MSGAAAAIVPAAIQGGSGILGSLVARQNAIDAGNSQRQLQGDANRQAVELENTSYQRAVTDMRAAGLNPGLMFGSGSAEGTPNIGVAGTPQELMPAQGIAMTGAAVANQLQQSRSLAQSQQGIDNGYLMQLEQIAKIHAEIDNLPTSTGLAELNKRLTAAQAKLAEFNTNPKSLNELGTRSLNAFLKELEVKYNHKPTSSSADDFFRDLGFPDFPLK